MADKVEVWIVDEATGETILRIDEDQFCPIHHDVILKDGWCAGCGLDWTVFS